MESVCRGCSEDCTFFFVLGFELPVRLFGFSFGGCPIGFPFKGFEVVVGVYYVLEGFVVFPRHPLSTGFLSIRVDVYYSTLYGVLFQCGGCFSFFSFLKIGGLRTLSDLA